MANNLSRTVLYICAAMALASCSAHTTTPDQDVARNNSTLLAPDAYTLIGPLHFVSDYAPTNKDGSVNVVIEIPTGTNAKWEVSKAEGSLQWTFKQGKPRTVNYLGYPGNYGMVPRTLLSKASGGDGDPLDIIVLGPALPRGGLISVKLIGVLKLLDGGEQDDKLIAVTSGTSFFRVEDMAHLNRDFPGVSSILETWFTHYKGEGEMQSLGFSDAQAAEKLLSAAIEQYRRSQ